MSQNHIQEQIDLIAKHEQDFLTRRTAAERLGDWIAGFAGSLSFVCIHLTIFAGWITFNTISSPGLRHFDPPPFPLLGTIVALEAILLASMILMRQSRMSRRAEERDHLMLQILLLTEKEITAVLGMDRQIAGRVGLPQVANDSEIEQLSQNTSIDDVAQTIKDKLPHD
ncbi:MAG TPA: DUF1003 domain-containing protein [Edaphobacter sp.]|nr:DUF1003 domain-containing protein [Edaphobacter sp.]